MEVDEAGIGEVEDKAEAGEVEEDNNRDKEEQAMSSMYFNVKPYSSLIMQVYTRLSMEGNFQCTH